MTAQKTGKEIRLPIHKTLQREIEEPIKDRQGFEYLFKSRGGLNKPITSKTAWLKIKQVGEYFGVYRLGTRSIRKTF
ncbi:phage integrase [Fusibacter sp. 3D3]|nr:phage integrase [Fusibacter sp. 3D3]